MKTYLVGGAVRDKLLHIPNHDRDWVVVGATPEDMLAQGYVAVGKDFPVFLHPQTKEEYALARTERKTGVGYTGFDCFFSPSVTIEEDLLRRDLTINAIAEDHHGQLVDPFDGQQDIEHRVLRHVSDAFIEDPLRVLRVARFSAKFYQLGFHIAPETLQLMTRIAQSGELTHLTVERIWQEWHKALQTEHPDRFILTLKRCQALTSVIPELEPLFDHQDATQEPGALTIAHRLAELDATSELRFAAMVANLVPCVSPKTESHSVANVSQRQQAITALCLRLKIPNEFRNMAWLMATHEETIHRAQTLSATDLLTLLNQIDVWRKPEQLAPLLIGCETAYRVKHPDSQDYPQAEIIRTALLAAQTVQVKTIIEAGFHGQAIRTELDRQRSERIASQLAL